MSVSRRTRWIVGLGLGLVGVGFGMLGNEYLAHRRRAERQHLEIPKLWARLAPYPGSARELKATTEGSLFTRAFRVSFSAPAADIERWLKDSPGTREATPEHPTPGVRHFAIKPGGGAQHAEVTVDDASGTVRIYVYWS